jgi:hypothetical protein
VSSGLEDSDAARVDSAERKLILVCQGKLSLGDVRREIEDLSAEPESLQVDGRRRSGLEVRLLLRVLDRNLPRLKLPSSSSPPRCGYQVYADRRVVSLLPRFAFDLAERRRDLLSRFSDLWAVDWLVVDRLLQNMEPRFIVEAWLSSPGRRLLRDVAILGQVPLEHTDCSAEDMPTDWSWARLRTAAGPIVRDPSNPFQKEWEQIHKALPGKSLLDWAPLHEAPVAVMQLLEDGLPLSVRAAAMTWLLNQSMEHPQYHDDETAHDLRDDLPLRLRSTLSPDLAAATSAATSLASLAEDIDTSVRWRREWSHRLECCALLHAAHLYGPVLGQGGKGGVLDAWRTARWLVSCLLRSPFLGGDQEALTVRLEALLPEPLPVATEQEHPLHPARFHWGGSSVNLAELLFVSAVYSHYHGRGETSPKLLPMPMPLVEALERIAGRVTNAGERAAEASLARSVSMVDPTWNAPHLAPPLLARYLLTARRHAWLSKVPAAVQQEMLACLAATPKRFRDWVPLAFHSSGAQIESEIQEQARGVWASLIKNTVCDETDCAMYGLMAAGLLSNLTLEERRDAIELGKQAAPQWRASVLSQIWEAAAKTSDHETVRAAVNALEAQMLSNRLWDTDRRLDAAHALLTLVGRSAGLAPQEQRVLLERLAQHCSGPPFSSNLALRRSLRALGIARN